jgi:hypothetical protein
MVLNKGLGPGRKRNSVFHGSCAAFTILLKICGRCLLNTTMSSVFTSLEEQEGNTGLELFIWVKKSEVTLAVSERMS